MKKVLLIIPAYNEEESILNTVNSIKQIKNIDYIIINDGSTDNTKEICFKNKLNHIDLIKNLGIGSAVQTGYKYAQMNDYDIAVQFDGDGQHDENYILKIIEPIIKEKMDFVIGSRFIENNSGFKSTKTRRVGIKVVSFLIKIFTGKRITDPTSGFRAANKDVIKLFADKYPFEYPEPESIVTLIKKKYRLFETPVKMKERTGGISSIRAWKTIYYMINVGLSIFVNSIKRGEK